MKISFNKYDIPILDNDVIKAIRFIYGVNPDLRVKLGGGVMRDGLYKFVDENRYGIFGMTYCLKMYSIDFANEPEKAEKWERIVCRVVDQVMGY